MAWNFNFSFGRPQSQVSIDDVVDNKIFYTILDYFNGKTKKFKSEKEKLDIVLESPAVLKVLTFLADTYSQVKFNEWNNDRLVEQDFLYSVLENPNPWQSWVDLHWDIAFWRSTGNAYVYKQNDVIYCLRPQGMELTTKQINKLSKLTFGKYGSESKRNILNDTFEYRNENNEISTLQLKNVYVLSDLSGGVSGNWFKGNSRLDALYNVVKNSDLSTKSKGINIELTGKFFASGGATPNENTRGIGEDEQKSIENSFLNKSKKIFSTKSKVDLRRLVESLKDLKLDESYISDLTIIANMYGIDKDVLGLSTTTYENKEKAIGSYVDYTLMPKVQQHSDLYENLFDKQDIRGSFKHLPFNAIFEAEKISNQKIMLEGLKLASELGMDASLVERKIKEIYGY
jgi:hypothetical protein